MPQKIKDAEGNEVDVFTTAELEEQVSAKAKEMSDAAVAAEQDRLKEEHEANLLEKEEALKEAEEKIEKLKIVEGNFKILRDKARKGDGVSEEEKKNAEDLKVLQETVQQIQKQPFETAKTNFVKNNVGADKELGEKFEFFYKKLGIGVKTVEEQQVALESAMTLAAGKPYVAGSGSITQTSVNADFGGVNAKPESQDSQNFGKELGISAEDKKTFSKVSGLDLLKPTPVKEKNA